MAQQEKASNNVNFITRVQMFEGMNLEGETYLHGWR